MKKLSLEMLRLTSDEVLQRSQMKKITGGYGSGSCGYAYNDGSGWRGDCGVSQSEARFMTAGYSPTNAYWCCQSCSTTFYCG